MPVSAPHTASTSSDSDHAPDQVIRPSPDLITLWADEFQELHPLESLSAEAPLLMWVAKQAASHNPAILVDLAEGTDNTTEQSQLYNRATSIQVEHFGVPQIVDARSPEAQHPYLAWSVEGGQTLRTSLLAQESISRRKALEIARSLAETLAELHRFDHAVSGLTPATLWLGPAGMIQILGLGLSRFDASGLHGEGLRYRAPEQLRREPRSMSERMVAGALRERADIWALGMITLELLDGRVKLHCQAPAELLEEIADSNLAPSSHTVAWELKTLIQRMLTLDVEQRDITAEEISAEMDGLLMATAERSLPRADTVPTATAAVTRSSGSGTTVPAQPDWNWRSAAKELSVRRQAFEEAPDPSTWKLWLLPMVALAALAALIWGLMTITGS